MDTLRIDIWSDIACPWCHVGKRRLEQALASFPHADQVAIVWRAFELDPSAPRVQPATPASQGRYARRLARKYGTSVARAEMMVAQMTAIASRDGLDFRFDRAQPGNTFDAHRLIHFALERGVQGAVKERFLVGYLSEGEPIGDREALVRMASEAGLDADEARGVLESDAYAREVRADERDAAMLGITGVPFFVFDRRFAVSGAQPTEVFEQALETAWGEREGVPQPFAEGAACGPDGCG
jgi:predicted DsbA family dithiol-disulfide isomerase